ncbi:MAG: tetratricopeptide repeat protein [Eubacteriales bacterium]|nr:tetratricopeptide repeat protein [Eubacteriales bacterium]
MICPRCHNNVQDKNKQFCPHCGYPLKTEKDFDNKKILIPVSITGVCLLIVLVAVLFFQKDTSASKSQAKINEGNRFLKQKDYDSAELCFNEALKYDKDSAEAKVGLADAYTHQEKPKMAA